MVIENNSIDDKRHQFGNNEPSPKVTGERPSAPPDPRPPPPQPVLLINIDSPRNGTTLPDPSIGPFNITGSYVLEVYSFQDLTVQIGNESPQRPVIDSTGQRWTLSARPKTTGNIVITATIIGRIGTTPSRSASRSVTVLIAPDTTKPDLTVTPIASVIELPEHETVLPLSGTCSDYFGVKGVQSAYMFSPSPNPVPLPNPISIPVTLDSSNWSATLTIPPTSVGNYTINIICTDLTGNAAQQTINFKTLDKNKPVGKILEPQEGQNFTNYGSGVKIILRGTSQDPNSGILAVEWSLDGGVYTQAKTADKWANWNDLVTILTSGPHTLEFRFSDNQGNSSNQSIKIVISGRHKPTGLADLLNIRAYLDDLLSFATIHIKTNSSTLVTKQDLEAVFCQPFGALADPFSESDWGNKPVNQVRVSIESLITYLVNSMGLKVDTDPNFKATKSEYLQDAYEEILQRIGTSYEEIRLIRGADDNKRRSLAIRLGIALSPARPDQLDALFIEPDRATDFQLEDLFGLINITSDPSKASAAEPKILKWQFENLGVVWRQTDFSDQSTISVTTSSSVDSQSLPTPIVDPDIINTNDFTTTIPGNAAFDLLTKRTNWLTEQLSSLRKLRESKQNSIDGLTAIVNSTLIVPTNVVDLQCKDKQAQPIDFLECLQVEMNHGSNIKPVLAQLYLTMEMFSYLLRLKSLAESGNVKNLTWNGIVTDLEWQSAYDILIQVMKKQQYTSVEKRGKRRQY